MLTIPDGYSGKSAAFLEPEQEMLLENSLTWDGPLIIIH